MSKQAVIFPGQGAQAVGMGKELAETIPECRAIFDQANDVLGHDLATICFDGPKEDVTRSSNAQPGIFIVSVAAVAALKARVPDISFDATAGLSSGEWAALYFAGAVSFEDALRVLQARGRYMQECCEQNPGAMIGVIGLGLPALEAIAAEADIQVANFNSPGQTVLSGTVEGVEKAEQLAKDAGAKRAIRLPVAGAFHSRLMQPAADRFLEFLSDIQLSIPAIPVISNVTGEPHGSPQSIRALMAEQVTASVQWVANVENLGKMGIKGYLECGPGKVLTGLVRRIDKEAVLHNIQDPSSLDGAVEALG